MPFYKFKPKDILINRIKTYADNTFFINNKNVYYNNRNQIAGAFTDNVGNIPTGSIITSTKPVICGRIDVVLSKMEDSFGEVPILVGKVPVQDEKGTVDFNKTLTGSDLIKFVNNEFAIWNLYGGKINLFG